MYVAHLLVNSNHFISNPNAHFENLVMNSLTFVDDAR